jgi:uncharacterized protein
MNPVTWFSIPAEDTERANEFYHKAFGWKVLPLTQEQNHLYDFNVALTSDSDKEFNPKQSGRVNGCIVKKAIGIDTPVVLIEVDDLEEAAQRVEAAGGTVVSDVIPMQSLNGAFMLVKDAEGNILELFKTNPKS